MATASYNLPKFQPKVTIHACGCVTTESHGHTHVKFCATCRTEYFAKAERREVEPDNLDLIGG